jgi:hypothetical protein
MKNKSLPATMFISLMAMAAMTVIVSGALSIHPLHQFQFASLTLLGVLTSRLKVRLPGLTGNMSMNLPFVLLAIVQLGLFEAAAIAFASTLIQSLPKRGLQLRPTQLLFDVSTMTTAAGLAYLLFHEFDGRHGATGSLRWCSPLPPTSLSTLCRSRPSYVSRKEPRSFAPGQESCISLFLIT